MHQKTSILRVNIYVYDKSKTNIYPFERSTKYELYKVLSCYSCKYTLTFIGNLKMTVIPIYGKLQRYMILKRMPNEVNFNMRLNSKLKLWFAMTNQHT